MTWYPFGSQAVSQDHIGAFGTMTDGAAVLDGTATVAWATKAGSVYTVNNEPNLTSLIVQSGVTLKTNGRRIFCAGPVVNLGTWANDGNAAAGATGGAGVNTAMLCGGGTGVTGVTGVGVAATVAGSAVLTGSGGAGGAGTSGAGGASTGARSANPSFLIPPYPALCGCVGVFGQPFQLGGGVSGSSGAGDGSNAGGGGGSGAGPIVVFAYSFDNSGGTLSAQGGAGGTPAAGNCGGGGGGGGGLIAVYTLAPWAAGTTSLGGGAAGTKTGTGVNGNAGNSGTAINVVLV